MNQLSSTPFHSPLTHITVLPSLTPLSSPSSHHCPPLPSLISLSSPPSHQSPPFFHITVLPFTPSHHCPPLPYKNWYTRRSLCTDCILTNPRIQNLHEAKGNPKYVMKMEEWERAHPEIKQRFRIDSLNVSSEHSSHFERKNGVTCFHCGKVGHMLHECRSRLAQENLVSITCP